MNGRRLKNAGEGGDDNGGVKTEEERKGNDNGEGEEAKKPEPPKDYIHVRARRGQATDSHSLAERVGIFNPFQHGGGPRFVVVVSNPVFVILI